MSVGPKLVYSFPPKNQSTVCYKTVFCQFYTCKTVCSKTTTDSLNRYNRQFKQLKSMSLICANESRLAHKHSKLQLTQIHLYKLI